MNVKDLYAQKTMSASDAVQQVRDGDLIVVPTGVGEPPGLLAALSEQRRQFHDVKVAQILAMRKTWSMCVMWRCSTVAPRALVDRPVGSTSFPTIFPKFRV